MLMMMMMMLLSNNPCESQRCPQSITSNVQEKDDLSNNNSINNSNSVLYIALANLSCFRMLYIGNKIKTVNVRSTC